MATFSDEMFEAQWVRAAAHCTYGGAELGECFEVAKRVGATDAGRWFAAWSAMAARLFEAAQASEAAGRSASARSAYLRASNYWRAAWTFDFEAPLSDRARAAYRRHDDAFRRAARLMATPGEPVRIPYDGRFLRGYLFATRDRAPTLIVNGGYDSTAGEIYLFSGAAAVERGYNVLVFDGPGQGGALFEDGLVFRPDWENVVGPVVDFLCGRPEVDAARIALMGISFGGYLAPRAASFEPRLAALIADPGQLSLFDEMKRRLPPVAAARLFDDKALSTRLLSLMLNRRRGHLTRGWALRRGMLTHGVASPLEYLRATAPYATGRPERIRCPTLITTAENDEIGATGRALHDRLTCDKTFRQFLAAEGAGGHCESGARAWFNQVAFDWLDERLVARIPADQAMAFPAAVG